MRMTLRTLLLLLIFNTANAQSGHFTQLVLEVKNFSNQKHVQLINNALSGSLGESHVVASCEMNGWVVLELDLNHYRNADQLLELLKPGGFEFIVKEGATAAEVTTACKGATQQF